MQLIIKFYRLILSPLFWHLGARCRFYPSCSEYAAKAFERLPWWKAFYYSARRILKCGPWNEGGIDTI